ncbi:MAG: hypothetical protein IJ068_05520 [Bacilli bacterium]|nr:hypothetical protein [Bacilli bacterium]
MNNKKILLQTIEYEKYSIGKIDFPDSLLVLGEKIKRLETKKCNTLDIKDSINNIGKAISDLNKKPIIINDTIDKLITKYDKNSKQLSKLYSMNFTDELFQYDESIKNIILSNDVKKLIIEFFNIYGIQTANSYVYDDIKLGTCEEYREAHIFELYPIINTALTYYLINNINDTLKKLANNKNRSYMYQKLEKELETFPSLYKRFKKEAFQYQENNELDINKIEYKYVHKINITFINEITSYLINFNIVLAIYLNMIDIPYPELRVNKYNPNIMNLSDYDPNAFTKKSEIHHTVLRICLESLLNLFSVNKIKCEKCGKPANNGTNYCCEHIKELIKNHIKRIKNEEEKQLFQNELSALEKDESSSVPNFIKWQNVKKCKDKYDKTNRKKLTNLQK